MIIGVCGSSGSGKTTFADNMRKFLNKMNKKLKIIVVSMDDFYKGKSNFSNEELEKFNNNDLNLDEPSMVHFDQLIQTVKNLKYKRPFYMPHYERHSYDVTNRYYIYDTYDVVIVEGILIFQNDKLTKYFDIKFFVETPTHICLKRRLARYDDKFLEKKLEYFYKFVLSSIRTFINPYKKDAHFVIDGTKHLYQNLNRKILETIFDFI